MITPPPPRVSSICCNYSIERLEGLAQGAVNRARFAWCDQQTLRVIDPLHFVPISNRRRTDRGPGLVLEVLDPRESRRARGFPRAQRTSAALDSRLVEVESVASRLPRKRNGAGGGKRTRCGTPTPAQTPPRLCEDGSRASLSVSPRNFFDENLKSEV